MLQYGLGEEVQNPAIRAFGRHDITLHIDDGCMGGGEKVSYLERFQLAHEFYEYKWGKKWDVNQNTRVDIGIDNLNGYFGIKRWHTFHYSIFVHRHKEASWSVDIEGEGEEPGDDFIVCDASIHSISNQAQTFMHELGHNLNLRHPDEDSSIPDDADTAMQSPLLFGTIDFYVDEWKKLDLNSFKNSLD